MESYIDLMLRLFVRHIETMARISERQLLYTYIKRTYLSNPNIVDVESALATLLDDIEKCEHHNM